VCGASVGIWRSRAGRGRRQGNDRGAVTHLDAMAIRTGLGTITSVDDFLAEIRQDNVVGACDFNIRLTQGKYVGIVGGSSASNTVIAGEDISVRGAGHARISIEDITVWPGASVGQRGIRPTSLVRSVDGRHVGLRSVSDTQRPPTAGFLPMLEDSTSRICHLLFNL
jgi:hypothetical protein